MFVSLLIPCRNATEWLPKFLPRLGRLHDATFPSFPEIIFVDDASDDGTPRLLFHWAETAFVPVKVLGLDAVSGLGASIREGVALAGGGAIALCLSPVAPVEHAIAPLLAELDRGADVAAISAHLDWRTAFLSNAIRWRHRLSRQSKDVMTSPFTVWRKEALAASIPRHDGLAAMVEAGLRSAAHGHRHSIIELEQFPTMTWQPDRRNAAKWLWRGPPTSDSGA